MADLPMRIGGALAGALQRQRGRFNAKYAESRISGRPVEADTLAEHLSGVVAPVAEAVALAAPERLDEVVAALFDLSLDLLGRRLLGEGGPIDRLWRRLLPDIPTALASAPRRVVGAVSNAAYNLTRTPGARFDVWLDEMDAMGSVFRTGDELLDVGRIVAWRAGMAHLRRSALDAVPSLRPELATAALGLDYNADIHDVVERLRVDPWADPVAVATHATEDAGPRIRARVGAFRGFGGLFHTPPTVVRVDGHFLVGDDESTWVLSVDRFGATFTRTGLVDVGDEIHDPSPALRLTESGTVHATGNMAHFERLAGASSWASDSDTLVATVPDSHAVYVVSAR